MATPADDPAASGHPEPVPSVWQGPLSVSTSQTLLSSRAVDGASPASQVITASEATLARGGSSRAPIDALLRRDARSRVAALSRHRGRRLRRLVVDDPLTALSLAIALSVLAMLAIDAPADPWRAIGLSAGFVVLQLLLGRVRPGARLAMPVRFGLTFVYIPLAGFAIDPGGGWPVNALVIPTVALSAAVWSAGLRFVLGVIAVVLTVALLPNGVSTELSRRLVALAIASAVMAVGSRQVVTSLERSRDRLRSAQVLQRRRSRRLGALERVGRILAHDGATPEALDAVVGLLATTFGYRYPSIYLVNGHRLRLGAQRNYAHPIEELPIERGVIGRVARTGQPVFLPDVSVDPDYVTVDEQVVGEIGLPLVAAEDLLGVLNVEVDGTRRLDAEDYATMQIVGDRVAAALALGRERQNLTERARLMDELASFSRSLGRSLDPETVHAQVAAGAGRVIRADMAMLILPDEAGTFRIARVEGGDPSVVGARIEPGEGISGRAIRDAVLVVDDHLERRAFPKDAAGVHLADTVAAMSVPLVGDGGVVGALSWLREDLTSPFSDQEREVAGLLASQVALAIANAALHHATELAAVTDGLTELNNRRYFDAAMARAQAARLREPEDGRTPRAAIMFDLDHFGQINKLHGHQVGDRILRAFADVLRARLRASDLVARFGGEEFVAVLDGTSREAAVEVAEQIRERFAGLHFALPDGSAVGCTVSAGCSALLASETAGSTLIERADVGLAMAKASGRNRVVAA